MTMSKDSYRSANLQLVRDTIGAWGDCTFPRDDRAAAVWGCAEHLDDEVGELKMALTSPLAGWEDIEEEIADVFILAFQLAHLLDIDVAGAISDKMAVNRTRTWSAVDERGVCKHVETGAPTRVGDDTCTDEDSSPQAQPP